MPTRPMMPLFTSLATIFLALVATALHAGSKVRVKGNVESVAEQVEGAFEQLNIDTADIKVSQALATAMGKARSGARVTVSVQHAGEDECEVSVSSDSPIDPDIEARFLRAIQSR